ncbi:MAG: VWA domain-containing protein [Chitinophagales bacterium]
MLKFAHTEYLWALLIVVVVILLFVAYLISRNKKFKKLGESDLVKQLRITSSTTRKTIKIVLMVLAIIALVIGWANPLVGTKYETVKREGIDVFFAIDVSKSMNAQDVAPSRMLKAKQFVSNLIDEMNNDRIGLIVFAGNAYLQMPITVDYSGAKMYLKTINTNMVPQQGTDISEAIDLALQSFDKESEGYKTLVIITDGENHDGDVEEKIKEAKEQGVIIHTIGIGSEKGAPIPDGKNGQYKKDNEGNVVLSKLNENMLKDIAKQSGGVYLNASSVQSSKDLLATLSGQKGRQIDEKVFTSFKNHFPLFLSIALVLLLIEIFISEKKWDSLGW